MGENNLLLTYEIGTVYDFELYFLLRIFTKN